MGWFKNWSPKALNPFETAPDCVPMPKPPFKAARSWSVRSISLCSTISARRLLGVEFPVKELVPNSPSDWLKLLLALTVVVVLLVTPATAGAVATPASVDRFWPAFTARLLERFAPVVLFKGTLEFGGMVPLLGEGGEPVAVLFVLAVPVSTNSKLLLKAATAGSASSMALCKFSSSGLSSAAEILVPN